MYFGYVRENSKQGNINCIIQHEYFIITQHKYFIIKIMLATQLEYFIIGGCTIQVLYSRTMPRVVLAFFFDVNEVKKKPALSFALYMRIHYCSCNYT